VTAPAAEFRGDVAVQRGPVGQPDVVRHVVLLDPPLGELIDGVTGD
jgi:hypothetical protein